jgi:hypothetical protein
MLPRTGSFQWIMNHDGLYLSQHSRETSFSAVHIEQRIADSHIITQERLLVLCSAVHIPHGTKNCRISNNRSCSLFDVAFDENLQLPTKKLVETGATLLELIRLELTAV